MKTQIIDNGESKGMEIITDITRAYLKNTAITIGKFDGLHKGHQKLFSLIREKKAQGMKAVVLTFNRSPREIVEGEPLQYILTEKEKYHYYEQAGIDCLIECTVNKEFMQLEAVDFIKKILVDHLGVRYLCAGSDFRYGKNRKGNLEMLKNAGEQYRFEVEIIEKEQYQKQDISSTFVRKLIQEGKMEQVEELLGYPYTMIGEIVHGNQLGRTVGMPTINLIPPVDKLLPPNGVYVSQTSIDGKKYQGITNVGYKPTVSEKHQITVETNLFHFHQDVYGKIAQLELLHFVRNEKKFDSLELVKEQVEKDIANCKKYFVE